MRALVYHGPGQKAWEEVPKPVSSTTPMPSSGSTPSRSAAPTCTSSKAMSRGHRRADPRSRGRRHRRDGRRRGQDREGRGPGAGVVHHRLRRVPVLPRRSVRPVPRRRRLDPRPHDRRHPGRVRPRAVRRHLHLPGSRRRHRRGAPHARRHPAHRLRGRRAQRRVETGRRGRRRRRGADRPVGHHGSPALQPEPRRGHRPGRQPGSKPPSSSAPTSRSTTAREDPLDVRAPLPTGSAPMSSIEAVGVPATFELAAQLIRPGGTGRQHRRARRAGDTAPRGALDP